MTRRVQLAAFFVEDQNEQAFVGSDRLRRVGRMYGTSKNYTARHGEIGTDADRADGCSRRTDP